MRQGMVGALLVTLITLQTGCVNLSGSHTEPLVAAGGEGLALNDSAKVCLRLAESLTAQGHAPEAIAQYEKARAFDPSLTQVSYPLALLYDRVGADAQALEEYQLAVAASPSNPALLNDLGYFHYSRGHWTQAEQQFRSAIQADPTYQRSWVNLGLALGQQGRYRESQEAFERVVSPAQARSNLAFVLATQGKDEQAAEAYRGALALDPTLSTAREALAKLSPPPATGIRTAYAELPPTEVPAPTRRVPDSNPSSVEELPSIPLMRRR